LTEDIVSGTVAQNFLNDAEYAQAQQVAEFRGGHFEGQPIENLPGFDGYINGEPASLKYIENSNPLGILQNVGKNDQALSKPENMKFLTENGYLKPGEQVEVFVFAPNVSSEKLADFASKGPLGQIPGRGRISGITVKTADGWLRISTH